MLPLPPQDLGQRRQPGHTGRHERDREGRDLAAERPHPLVRLLHERGLNGGVVYYRPGAASGQFQVTAAGSTDTESGFASYSFPAAASGWSVSGARRLAHVQPLRRADRSGRAEQRLRDERRRPQLRATSRSRSRRTRRHRASPRRRSQRVLHHDLGRRDAERRHRRRLGHRGRLERRRARRGSARQQRRNLRRLPGLLGDGHPLRRQRHDRGQRQVLPLSRAALRQRRQPGLVGRQQHGQGRHERAERPHALLRVIHERGAERRHGLVPAERGQRPVPGDRERIDRCAVRRCEPHLPRQQPRAGASWLGNARTYSHTGSPFQPGRAEQRVRDERSRAQLEQRLLHGHADSTAPSVTAPSVTAGYYTSLSVRSRSNGGSDSESGLNAGSSVVERDEAPLDNGDGSCDAFPGSWSTVTLSGGNDTTVVSGKCYRYRELLSDNVGNQGASGASNTAKVDTSAPADPALSYDSFTNAALNGGVVWYRPSAANGQFQVTASSSDVQSGVAATPSRQQPRAGRLSGSGTRAPTATPGAPPIRPSRTTCSRRTGPASTRTTSPLRSRRTRRPLRSRAERHRGLLHLTLGRGLVERRLRLRVGPRGRLERRRARRSAARQRRRQLRRLPGLVDDGHALRRQRHDGGQRQVLPLPRAAHRQRRQPRRLGRRLDGQGRHERAERSFTLIRLLHERGTQRRTVYYRPSAASGQFQVTASSNDSHSGVACYGFPAAAPGWSVSGSGASRTYSHSGSPTDPAEPNNVFATNGAGSTRALRSRSRRMRQLPDHGADHRGLLHLTFGPLSLNSGSDSESGLAAATSSSATKHRSTTATAAATPSPGSWSTVTLSGGNDTTVVSGKCYRYRELLSDSVGNQVPLARAARPRSTPRPRAHRLSYGHCSNAMVNGRPSTTGRRRQWAVPVRRFERRAVRHRPPRLPGRGLRLESSQGWAAPHLQPRGSPNDPAEPNDVTAINGAGLTSGATSFTVTPDATALSGFSASVTGGYYRVDRRHARQRLRQRLRHRRRERHRRARRGTGDNATAPATPSPLEATVTLAAQRHHVVSGKCYRYRLLSDRVGNESALGPSATAKIDTPRARPRLSYGCCNAIVNLGVVHYLPTRRAASSQ